MLSFFKTKQNGPSFNNSLSLGGVEQSVSAAGTGRCRYKATPFSGLPSQSVSSSPRVPINQKNTEEYTHHHHQVPTFIQDFLLHYIIINVSLFIKVIDHSLELLYRLLHFFVSLPRSAWNIFRITRFHRCGNSKVIRSARTLLLHHRNGRWLSQTVCVYGRLTLSRKSESSRPSLQLIKV